MKTKINGAVIRCSLAGRNTIEILGQKFRSIVIECSSETSYVTHVTHVHADNVYMNAYTCTCT